MGAYCVTHPHVRNNEGNVVKSQLFSDLLKFTGNDYNKSWEMYAVSQDKKFLARVESQAEFDNNGELTFNSLRKLAKLDFENSRLMEEMNKELGSGVYSYDEAIDRLTKFNRESQFKDDYMATVTETKNGKMALQVVEKTDANQVALHDTIRNRSLSEQLDFLAKRKGVEIDITERDDEGGRYSTVNAEKKADGMYHLIRVSKGERMAENKAEESGHFAIAALNKSPLVQRLLKLLTPEVQKAELGDEYETAELGPRPEREVAGRLVGKALINKLGNQSAAQRLVHRIVDLAKRVFAAFTANDVLKARLEADRLADHIAYQYELGEGSLDDALAIEETLYHKNKLMGKLFGKEQGNVSQNLQDYKKLIKDLQMLIYSLEGMGDKSLAKSMQGTLEQVLRNEREGSRPQSISETDSKQLNNVTALQGIAAGLIDLLDKVGPGKEVNNMLETVNMDEMDDTIIFKEKQIEWARTLRQVHTFAMSILSFTKALKDNMESYPGEAHNIQLTNEYDMLYSVSLQDLYNRINPIIDGLVSEVHNKEKKLYLKFCETIVGKNYIERASRLIWSRKAGFKRGWLMEMEGGKVSLDSLMTSLDKDITYFERYIASMANCSDIMGQIIDKAVSLANKEADDLTNRDREKLVRLEVKMNKYGFKKLDVLLERSRDADKYGYHQLTGNIRSDRNWGDWERDRTEWLWGKRKDPEYKFNKDDYLNEYEKDGEMVNMWGQYGEFLKAHKDDLEGLTEIEKTMLWNDFMHDRWKQWNKDHSEKDPLENRWRPNEDYKDEEFEKDMYQHDEDGNLIFDDEGNMMFTKLGELWNDYMNIKRDIDSRLPQGSTLPYRAPQFKGRFTQKVQNQGGGRIKRITHTLRRQLHDKFCMTENDEQMWGSEITYNSEDEMLFSDELAADKEKIHRLPLYGINRLKDMSELSTDLFASTLAYSNMANTHQSLGKIVDMVEVGEEVLRGRTHMGFTEGNPLKRKFLGKSPETRAFTRLQKYIDKSVYGVTAQRIPVPWKGVVLEKVLAAISSFGSKYFLGGNVAGGIVNTMTGFNEIFKEAWAMENFTPKQLWTAHKWYWSNQFKELIPGSNGNMFSMTGRQFKDDKISLIINHFDVLNKNREKFKNYKHDRSTSTRLYNALINNSIWWPYSTGDHYMNTIPFLSMMAKTEIYDENGKAVPLYDSYKVTDIDYLEDENDPDSKVKTGRKMLMQEGEYYVEKDGAKKAKLIQSIIDGIEGELGPFKTKFVPDADQQRYLDERKALATPDENKIKEIDRHFNDYNLDNKKRVLRTLERDLEELKWGYRQETELMDRAQEVSVRMHGIYNNQDKTAFHQTYYGGPVLAMRGYALGMMERRFSQSKYSLRLGRESEGSYNTAIKALVAGILGFNPALREAEKGLSGKQLLNRRVRYLWNGLLPWNIGDRSNTKWLKERGFGEHQIANMRRHQMDMFLALMYGFIYSCSAADDDDDDTDRTKGLMHYFSHRLFREQAAFLLPKEMRFEMGSLLSYMPSGFAALYDLFTIIKGYLGQPFADYEDSEYYYVNGPNAGRSKAEVKTERKLPYYRFGYVYYNPVEAEKGIDYVEQKNAR